MLVIRIELWPHGNETRRKTVATGFIANSGTGTPTQGNYRVELSDALGRRWRTGTIEGFPRKRLLAWDLLTRALYSVLGGRNGLANRANCEEISSCSTSVLVEGENQ